MNTQGVRGMAGMREGNCRDAWRELQGCVRGMALPFKKALFRIFFSYNLALSEKKCNFVGDIQLKEKIMATLTDVDAETMRQRLVVKESLTQAFKELRAAEASGAGLPDARKIFK